MSKVYVTTIDEEFEKARVKAHVRTRKGKLERVREFERKGEKREIPSGLLAALSGRAFKSWKKDGRSYRKNPTTGRVQIFTFEGWRNTGTTKAEKEKHAGELAKRSGKERKARQLAREAGYTYSLGRLKKRGESGRGVHMSIGEVIDKFSKKRERILNPWVRRMHRKKMQYERYHGKGTFRWPKPKSDLEGTI